MAGGAGCDIKRKVKSPSDKLAQGYRSGAATLFKKLHESLPSDPDVKVKLQEGQRAFRDYDTEFRKLLSDLSEWARLHGRNVPMSEDTAGDGTEKLPTEIRVESLTQEPSSIREVAGELYRPYRVDGTVVWSLWSKSGKQGEVTTPIIASATRDGDWKFPDYGDIKREVVAYLDGGLSQTKNAFRQQMSEARNQVEMAKHKIELEEALEKSR